MKKLLLLMLISLFCNSWPANSQLIHHADTTTNPTLLKDLYFQRMRHDIEEQRTWFLSLLVSQKAYERLKREYLCTYTDTSLCEKEIKKEFLLRQERVRNGHYNIVYVHYIDDKPYIGDVLDTVRIFIGEYAKKSPSTVIDLKTQQPVIFLHFQFEPSPGEMVIKSVFDDQENYLYAKTAPLHEFSHMSTDMDGFMLATTVQALRKITKEDYHDERIWNSPHTQIYTKNYHPKPAPAEFPTVWDTRTKTSYTYYDNPSEVKARVDVLRYLLWKAGIYDARKEDFTEKHLELLNQNKEILRDPNISELSRRILKKPKEDIVWLLNNLD